MCRDVRDVQKRPIRFTLIEMKYYRNLSIDDLPMTILSKSIALIYSNGSV